MTMQQALPSWIDPPARWMSAPIVEYYDDGTISSVCYKNRFGNRHRTDGPAEIMWHPNGIKACEQWYHKGKVHRTDGPAIIKWDENGQQFVEAWYQNALLHRENKPACTHWDESGRKRVESWYQNYDLVRTQIYVDQGIAQ